MSKLIELNSLKNIDYKETGLKCGLEIHQQLNTGKLFCTCPCEITSNENLNKKIERKLRFSLSETGEIDKAALNEFKKGKYNIYQYNNEVACLVELDEEPPKAPNQKALNATVQVSQMLNIKFFNKIQFMRKLIIDGSVTTGFQKTAMLGINGELKTSFGKIEINGVNLEEDSCRTIKKEHSHTIFALDRQGIPLIEITTGPQIKTPMQAYETAKQIGNILRSFKETKRGLGTIRQDLNVSINGGARVEIKGTQNLKMIPQIVENEVKRQIVYLSILEELKSRKIDKNNFSDKKIYDITKILEHTTSKIISENLKEDKSAVLAIKLNNFKNILGCEIQENYRFATEISEKNKQHFPQIKGLFHLDENLLKYGLTENEIENIKKKLELKTNDSFMLIAAKIDTAQNSLKYILEIIEELIEKIPSEVRQVDPKGTITKFLRAMPGSARMYPETDIKEIELTTKYLNEMKKNLPEEYEKKLQRLKNELNLEESKILEILESYDENEIKTLIFASGKNANYLYNILFDLPKDIKKRDNIEPINFKISLLEDLLKTVNKENINQKIIRDIFLSLYQDKIEETSNLKSYLDKKGFLEEKIPQEIIEKKIKEIVEKNKGAPIGALMGHCMREFNAKVDGKTISEILQKILNN